MAVIFIFIIILFLIFYVLTRVIWVRVICEDKVIIELHLPILSLKISNDPDGGKKEQQESKKKKLSKAATIRIISAVIKRVKTSKIEIKKIKIPFDKQKLLRGNFFGPIGYQYAIFAVVAYLSTKTEKLTIEDNAITLSPDIKRAQFYITVKPRMYEFISALIAYKIQHYKEIKTAKED